MSELTQEVLEQQLTKFRADVGEDFTKRLAEGTMTADDKVKLQNLANEVQRVSDEQRRLGNKRHENDRVRLQSQNGYDGMPLNDAVFQSVITNGAVQGGVNVAPQYRERAMSMDADIVSQDISGEQIEQHVDGLQAKLKSRGLPENPVLNYARDQALGRVVDGMDIPNIRMQNQFTSTSAGAAIPTIVATEMWASVLLLSELVNIIPNVPMTSDKMEITHFSDNMYSSVGRSAGELEDQYSAPVTIQSTRLDVADLNGYQQLSNNSLQDASPAVLSEFQTEIDLATALAIEDAIINADNRTSNNVNSLSTIPSWAAGTTQANLASRDPRLIGWLGMRAHVESAARDNASGALTAADLFGLRTRLGAAGRFPQGFRYLMYHTDYYNALNLTELAQYDQAGAMATILSGLLGQNDTVRATPVIVTEAFPDGFLATGLVSQTPAQNTTGSVLAFVPDLFRIGMRKMPTITIQPTTGAKVGMGQDLGVHTRLAFNVRQNIRPGRRAVSEVYNITR